MMMYSKGVVARLLVWCLLVVLVTGNSIAINENDDSNGPLKNYIQLYFRTNAEMFDCFSELSNDGVLCALYKNSTALYILDYDLPSPIYTFNCSSHKAFNVKNMKSKFVYQPKNMKAFEMNLYGVINLNKTYNYKEKSIVFSCNATSDIVELSFKKKNEKMPFTIWLDLE
eukprot:TRINITY_DN9372_c0_g1_i1.p1 TRINITY_DN9372_c0_g1~~TRINITY_DN9372_c0_g1_i1.p1  ORF type:complete len:194 (-),score=36.07 TRINITY_DN9372_c0_g1_i1:108-617(-)